VQEEVETADFGEEACRDIVASWLGVIWMKRLKRERLVVNLSLGAL